MAYDDSEALQPNSTYSLGGYTFELKVQNVHEPGEPDVVSVFAICRSPDGTRETVPMDFPSGTTVESWSVEANETEASVYVVCKSDDPGHEYNTATGANYGEKIRIEYDGTMACFASAEGGVLSPAIFASDSSGGTARHCIKAYSEPNPWTQWETTNVNLSYTKNGKTVYYGTWATGYPTTGLSGMNYISPLPDAVEDIAWDIIYDTEGFNGEVLVARFAIDIREADGGPDGDWDEPGSDGPFSDQIYVEVTGASAGAHSASNIPQEAPEQLTYGSGGIGGNGGGGGAGASTVIIYDFVSHKTSIDGPAENAIIREPGTGGPGGKGGKGGDGCILIFY